MTAISAHAQADRPTPYSPHQRTALVFTGTGTCVRMCKEQMAAGAIGFEGRGEHRRITTPFNMRSEVCRQCGGCIYVCPACQLRCTYTEPDKAVCGACANLSTPCLVKDGFDDMLCYMKPCVACEIPK